MLALAAGAAFTSCEDQLDIPQKGVIASTDFYQQEADCEKALSAAYENFLINTLGRTTLEGGPGIYTPAKVLANHPGDDVLYAGGNYGDHEFGGALNEFRVETNPEAVDFHYKGLYLSVYACNIILDTYENVNSKFIQQAVAEARVLRAYDYFLLACYWGQPPFVEHVLSGDAMPENNVKTQQEYYEWVAEECMKAADNLNEREGLQDKNGAVRVTKGFAYALAGKAYMFAKKYDDAKNALWQVIQSKKYDLVPGEKWADLFHIEGDCNEEKVFEANLEYNPSSGDWSFGSGVGYMQHSTWMESNCFNWRAGNFVANPAGKYCGIDGWGSIGIPQWFGEAMMANEKGSYRCKGTLMTIEDAVYQTSGVEGMAYYDIKKIEEDTEAALNKQIAEFEAAEKEKKSENVDILKYGKKEFNEKTKKWTYVLNIANLPIEELKASKRVGISDNSQGLYGQSFYLPVKHLIRANDVIDNGKSHGNNLRLNNIIVMRYAEVLLLYAEACLRATKADPNSAKTYLNLVQKRAGAPETDATIANIIREKSFELWFEGCRFQDVLRWGNEASDAFARMEKAGSQTPHLFDKLYRPVKSTDENVVWQHGSEANSRFYMAHTHEAKDAGVEVGFKKGRNELFPYPLTVLSQNPNMKQNPGY